MTGDAWACESVTISEAVAPSTMVASPIDTVGRTTSSETIVPTPRPSASVAWTGLERSRAKVSVPLAVAAPSTGAVKVFYTSPGA